MITRIIIVLLAFCFFASPLQAKVKPVSSTTQAKQTQEHSKINLNKADVAQLTHSFKGIGKKRADAIIAYRKEHQPFESVQDLAKVKGFGDKFVKINLKALEKIFTTQD